MPARRSNLPQNPPRPRAALAVLIPSLAACLAAAWAPAPAPAQSRTLRFDSLSIEDGLSLATVQCILQDDTGFLWAGTQDGLNRYDGYGFEVYRHDPGDARSLPDDWVQTLWHDHRGLWIGTYGGLALWPGHGDGFEVYRHDPDDPGSLPGNRVRAIVRDADGRLWVGTESAGLARLDEARGVFVRHAHDPADAGSLGDDRVRALHVDRAGRLWVGTLGGLGLYRRASGTFRHFRHDPDDPASLGHDGVLSLAGDRAGRLWVGTQGGLDRLDAPHLGFRHFRHDPADAGSLAHDLVRVLFQDDAGRLWIGTDGGLSLLEDPSADVGDDDTAARFVGFHHEPGDATSLGSDRLMAIHQDRGGMLWFAPFGGGLARWHPRSWSFAHYRCDPGDPMSLGHDSVLAFSEDAEGRLWVGTLGGGVDVLDRRRGRVVRHRHDPDDAGSLGDDRVTTLLHDRDGVAWVGTLEDGLFRFDPERRRFEPWRAGGPEPVVRHGVMALHQDRAGDLWVGTFGGGAVRRSRDDGVERYRHDPGDPHSLGDDRVTSFADAAPPADASAGGLWLGTSGGLAHFDRARRTFRRFRHDPHRPGSLASDRVNAVHVDAAGTLWVGTQDAGLNQLLDRGPTTGGARFRSYLERDGLPSRVINAILSDGRGRLWLSTNGGLARLDPRSDEVETFRASHGLQSDEFHFGAAYRSPSGELFFGGVEGFNAFFPEDIEPNHHVPPVVVASVRKLGRTHRRGRNAGARSVGGVPVGAVERLELLPGEGPLSVELAALDFTAPDENRYAYRLEGQDDEWIELGHLRRLTFTGLEPGRYVLHVRGSNNDGVWNREGLSVPLVVTPPAWRGAWAHGVYGLAAALAAVAVGRFLYRRSRRREALHRAWRAAEAAGRAKDELLVVVSRELRAPANDVLGALRRLRGTPLSEEQARCLAALDQGGEALQRLVDGLADFAEAESGRLRLDSAAFEPRSMVEEVLARHAPGAGAKGLDLACWLEPQVPETVIGDAARIRRVLCGLLAAAVARTDAGEVAVEVTARAPSTEADRWLLGVSVRDTGADIPAEDLERLFQPLARLDPAGDRHPGGSGLELAVCKRLAEAMGGRLEVLGDHSSGSTLRLELPVGASVSPGVARIHRPRRELVGRRARLLGDSLSMTYLGRYLRAWGLEVEPPRRGDEAARPPAHDAQPPDLLVVEAGAAGSEALRSRRTALLELASPESSVPPSAPAGRVRHAVLARPFEAVRLLEAVLVLLAPDGEDPSATEPAPHRSEVGSVGSLARR